MSQVQVPQVVTVVGAGLVQEVPQAQTLHWGCTGIAESANQAKASRFGASNLKKRSSFGCFEWLNMWSFAREVGPGHGTNHVQKQQLIHRRPTRHRAAPPEFGRQPIFPLALHTRHVKGGWTHGAADQKPHVLRRLCFSTRLGSVARALGEHVVC